ncbi:MAG: DUF359 domain-containing protein [Candidatus Altiarchaeota archaeon]|nr:DUF359 domain-containing protein [Candidatus Altiarchaeota archaeon]
MAFLGLPAHLRRKLKKPLGNLLADVSEVDIRSDTLIICVGDKTTEEILKRGFRPKICVYDGKIKRKGIQIPEIIEKYDAEKIRLNNPPGSLNIEVFNAIDNALKSKKGFKIRIDGEEDLITLAAIDRAPIDSLVFYGQPGEGVVAVRVDEEKKKKVKEILEAMQNEN